MKFSLSGHSCVQEFNNAHSAIEKAMSKTDFYSLIRLIRILKSFNTHNPYKVIQLKPNDFKDYGATAKLLNHKTIPFTEVCMLDFTQQRSVIKFKTSHHPLEPMQSANIKFSETPLRHKKNMQRLPSPSVFDIKPKVLTFCFVLHVTFRNLRRKT